MRQTIGVVAALLSLGSSVAGAYGRDVEPPVLRLPTPSRPGLEVPAIRKPELESPRLRREPLRLVPAGPKPKLDSLPKLESGPADDVPKESDE